MKFLLLRLPVVVLFVLLVIPLRGFAQSSSSSTAATRNVANNVNNARNQVTQASQAFAAAQSQFNEAQSKNRFQTRHVQTVRLKVFEEHDKSSVLDDARKEQDKLDKEFKALMKPILDHVRAQSDYRALAKKHQATEREVKDGEDVSETRRNSMLQEVISMQTEMRNMEKAAVLENTECKAAYASLQAARARLKELCQQRDQEIEADSNLSGAYSDLKSSKQELEQAKVQVATQSQRLAAAEQMLMNAMAAQAAMSRNRNTRRRN